MSFPNLSEIKTHMKLPSHDQRVMRARDRRSLVDDSRRRPQRPENSGSVDRGGARLSGKTSRGELSHQRADSTSKSRPLTSGGGDGYPSSNVDQTDRSRHSTSSRPSSLHTNTATHRTSSSRAPSKRSAPPVVESPTLVLESPTLVIGSPPLEYAVRSKVSLSSETSGAASNGSVRSTAHRDGAQLKCSIATVKPISPPRPRGTTHESQDVSNPRASLTTAVNDRPLKKAGVLTLESVKTSVVVADFGSPPSSPGTPGLIDEQDSKVSVDGASRPNIFQFARSAVAAAEAMDASADLPVITSVEHCSSPTVSPELSDFSIRSPGTPVQDERCSDDERDGTLCANSDALISPKSTLDPFVVEDISPPLLEKNDTVVPSQQPSKTPVGDLRSKDSVKHTQGGNSGSQRSCDVAMGVALPSSTAKDALCSPFDMVRAF